MRSLIVFSSDEDVDLGPADVVMIGGVPYRASWYQPLARAG
jgi:hypothetical protein